MANEEGLDVRFINVGEKYVVTLHGGIKCYFNANSSILPCTRHTVGIFPVNWKSVKDGVVSEWSPIPREYDPEKTVNSFLTFSGERLVRYADQFDTTRYQFCYLDEHNNVQGMSREFQLISAMPVSRVPHFYESSTFMSTSCGFETPNIDDDVDDFVEIEEDDGEIVVIKTRSSFLEEQLEKVSSAAKLREKEFDREKITLLRQINELRNQIDELTTKNKSLHDRLSEKDQQMSELQQTCNVLHTELVEIQHHVCRTPSHELLKSGRSASVNTLRDMAAAASDEESHPINLDVKVATDDGAAASSESHHRHISTSSLHSSRSAASMSSSVSAGSAASASAGSAASGVHETTAVSSPAVLRRFFQFSRLQSVGLNFVCHLKESLNQFSPDNDELYEIEPGVTRAMLSAFDRSPTATSSNPCEIEKTPIILRPPSSSAASSSTISCPFCFASFSDHRISLKQQLMSHLQTSRCADN